MGGLGGVGDTLEMLALAEIPAAAALDKGPAIAATGVSGSGAATGIGGGFTPSTT